MRMESVLLSIVISVVVSFFFYEVSMRTEGEFMISKITLDEYLMFGLITSFLGFIGDMLT